MVNLANQYCESATDGLRLRRPASIIDCQGPCEGVRWMYGQWSDCSVPCGGGIRYRTAVCVDSEANTLENDQCSAIVPEKTQECSIESCPMWKIGDWTEVKWIYFCFIDLNIIINLILLYLLISC